jgi:PAS domain S-box-containing protein
MNDTIQQHSTTLRKSLTIGTFVIVAVAALVAAWMFVGKERARDVRTWQVRLNLIADSRATDIGRWLDNQFSTLSAISDNAAVQLYVMQLAATGDQSQGQTEPAERSYLRNLLIVTAEHGGFSLGQAGPQVPANVQTTAISGIAIVDRNGGVMVSTPGMPAIDDSWRAFLAAANPGHTAVYDLYAGPTGLPTMGFAVPLYQVQGDNNPNQQIAWVIGIKDVTSDLYPLMKQPGTTEKTLETILVRRSDNVVEYLSPLLDGFKPLQQRSVVDPAHLAEAAAFEHPGDIDTKSDYRDKTVLFTSRTLPHVSWLLVEKIDRDEALADSEVRANRLLILLVVSIATLAAAFIAVWRHGASVRATESAERYRITAHELDLQKRLLNLVTDSVPDSIFIIGPESKLTFANRALGDRFGLPTSDLIGKAVAAVFGPEEARRYSEAVAAAAAANGTVVSRTDRTGEGPTLHVSQTRTVALSKDGGRRNGVLALDADITEVVRAREKHEAMLQKLVSTLVKIVDQRDPTAVGQSERVAKISAEIATEMKLDQLSIDTASISGRLVNFWKVLVPSEVLTRAGPLSEEEMNQSRQAALRWADFVDGIGFDGPVAETLRQIHERYDGSGWPKGLKGSQILIPAQIIALANQVVAMTSDRSYRKGADIADVAKLIAADAGTRYHAGVVAAFLNCVENRGARERWGQNAS